MKIQLVNFLRTNVVNFFRISWITFFVPLWNCLKTLRKPDLILLDQVFFLDLQFKNLSVTNKKLAPYHPNYSYQ